MKELSLHLLDLAENSVAAGASKIRIDIFQSESQDLLRLGIADDGRGMPPEILLMITDPFVTSRTTRKVGLGIPLFKAAAEACNGDFTIDSTPGQGTRVCAEFQLSHIDRMPLGDLANTFLTLLVAHPEVNWGFNVQIEHENSSEPHRFEFDDAEVKSVLDDVPLCHPDVLAYLKAQFQDGIKLQAQTGLSSQLQF